MFMQAIPVFIRAESVFGRVFAWCRQANYGYLSFLWKIFDKEEHGWERLDFSRIKSPVSHVYT
jgi:hypothetical protein